MLPKPFLKWPGGKQKIIDKLLAHVPKEFNAYHEPFLGGGALFFALYRQNKLHKKSILSDLNSELIDTYIAIRDNVEAVISLLSSYPYDKNFYYQIRDQNPWQLDNIHKAARMIYLNRTCYNGLYRVNRQGKFNVPFGSFKNPPKICDADNLRAVSKALQNTELVCADFSFTLLPDRAQPQDFVYFDPPYDPTSDTANFTSYTAQGFGINDQIRLRDIAKELVDKGVYVMISNSATEFIRQLYKDDFIIYEIEVGRSISCNAKTRKGWKEFIICSYK